MTQRTKGQDLSPRDNEYTASSRLSPNEQEQQAASILDPQYCVVIKILRNAESWKTTTLVTATLNKKIRISVP